MRIDIWSDIVCPWCYIGKRRFEGALAGFEQRDKIDVVHRSFQLDSVSERGAVHNHRDRLMLKYGMSRSEADATQIRMERTAAEEGLEFRLVGGVTGNTVDAHRLLCLARERGMQHVLLERLYRAHFTEQRSVFDPESLAVLAGEVGLDREDAAGVLAGESYADAVAADIREARQRGIGGVPHYLFDRQHTVAGAQPAESFSRALTEAWRARAVPSGT